MSSILSLYAEPGMQILIIVTAVTGFVRGFTGFGTGMLFIPVASSIFEPRVVVVMIWLIDAIAALPIVAPAFRRCDWRDVIPLTIFATLAVPLGVYLLRTADPVPVRWMISILTMVLVATLWSGWRYRGRPGLPITGAAGFASGFLGGFAGLPGPPVILFWMGGQSQAATTRANIIVFFAFLTILYGINFYALDLITHEVITRAIALIPVFLVSVLIGSRLFAFSSEKRFRSVAYILMIVSAVLGLPALDGVFR